MPAFVPNPYMLRYMFWDPSTMAVPKLYWDAFSQEQRWHAMCREMAKLIAYDDYQTEKILANRADIDELQVLFEKFMQSGFDDYYKAQIIEWINSHLDFIFDHVVKQVYFGLNEEGYFVAYIPESWGDIVFDTGMDYGIDTYGRLILRWDVDNSGESVNQRPEDWS